MHYTDLNTRVQQLNQKIGGNWDPQYQLLWVMEELGEVSREFLKTATLPAKGVDKIDSEPDTEKLQEEIGDVLYGLASFCHSLDLDLLDCFRIAIEKFEQRHS